MSEATKLAEEWKGRADDAGRLSRAVLAEVGIPSEKREETAALKGVIQAKDIMLEANRLQIECLRVVLSAVSAKANIDSDALVDMLREVEERIRHEGERVQ